MKKYISYRNDDLRSHLNFRDIGGVPAAGNKKVKSGLIFRSANPDRISRKDIEKLRKLNIRTIIDLRAPNELKRKFVSIDHAEKLTLSLDFQLKTRERLKPVIYRKDAQPLIADISNDLYLEILDASIPVVGQIFEILAAPGGAPILIHCQAGKDRTGIVTAVILLALGVEKNLIIDDFMKSNEALLPFFKKLFLLRRIISFGFFPYRNLLFAVTVKKRNIESILSRIDTHYGGIDAFMRKAGVTEPKLAEIKEKLLSDLL
jgi:protein-tyrosine phosphatase